MKIFVVQYIKEVKEMEEKIFGILNQLLDGQKKLETRFDGIETRFDGLENQVKENTLILKALERH